VNLLGALTQVVTDRVAAAVAAASGQSLTGAAALSALDQFLDRPTIDQLRQVLGLTPSGAVRLVDRLAEAGYVTRGPGADGRSRSVALTDEGRRAAARIAEARAAVLNQAVEHLTEDERATLHALLGRVIEPFVRANIDHGPGRGWICRLCDLPACGRAEGRCPTANAAAAYHRVAARR
jgi:DNA-binding MarR family transcriptional regulator